MKINIFAFAAILSVITHAHPNSHAAHSSSAAMHACDYLHSTFPNKTFFANETKYIEDNTNFWTSRAALGPACDFTPANAEDMSVAVKALTFFKSPFAIRGGGHMPIADAANINSTGVLLSSSMLKDLRLSADKTSVFIGPGNRWGDVYKYLEPYGLTVVGGRLGVVGVPGFLLGGGISFFSNQYGWASDNVKSITGVLADGRIVKATAQNKYADLFWASKGGGNSFALIVSFELRTLYRPTLQIGQATYGTAVGLKDIFLNGVYTFALNGSLDSHAAVTPTVSYSGSTNTTIYTAMKFYDGDASSPAALENFTSPVMPTQTDNFAPRSMYNWTSLFDASFAQAAGMRQRFYVVSIYADRNAMSLIHDIYLSNAAAQLSNVTGLYTSMAFMPITKQYIEGGNAIGGSDPQGIDATKAPYIWVEESLSYASPNDDSVIDQFLIDVNAKITAALQAENIEQAPYLYLNDADKGQPVFQGYPKQNLAKLKKIRAKYDPARVFTDLMPGGWKVAHA